LAAKDAPIELVADPDDPESLFFSLSMPLLTLEGADESSQLAFLWHLTETSAAGALPPGYLFFGDWEEMSISLGAQFSAQGLELGTLENIVDEFYRYGQVLRESLVTRLEAIVSGQAPASPDSAVFELPGREEFLRV
jgi:hypothetical protein